MKPDYTPAYVFSHKLWFILAIFCMVIQRFDAATMFFVGAIYCRLMEATW